MDSGIFGNFADPNRKERLREDELKDNIAFANQNIGNLQSKLSTLHPNSPEYQQTMQALQQQVAARNDLFHPAKNPGAFAKFGHMLTDAVHLTNPQQRQQRQQQADQQKSAQQLKSEMEARLVAAGAPPDPAAVAAHTSEAQEQQTLKNWDAVVNWAQKNGVGGEALEELKQHLVGIPATKGTPVGKPYKGADGKFYQPMRGQDGKIYDEPMPDDYAPPPSASMGKPVRAWTLRNGKPVSVLIDPMTNKPIPGSENDQLVPPPYLTQKISSGVYHWVDADGNIHETAETRTSGPAIPKNGGGEAPGAKPPAAGKKGAGKSNTGRAAAPAGGGKPGDRILGWKGTPTYQKAANAYSQASNLASLFDAQDKHRSPEGDTNLVLTLIRSEAGRVNQTEIASMFNAGGIAMAPDRWAAKVHGKLPDELYEQLRTFVHDLADTSKATMDSLRPKTPGDFKQTVQPPPDKKKENDPLGIL